MFLKKRSQGCRKDKRGDEKEAESILREIKKESVKILSSCIQI